MAENDTNRGGAHPVFDRYGQRDELDVIGTSTPRIDAVAKVTGGATYTHDVILPGMCHAVIVRSPHAAALVLDVDTAAARALPGVRAVLAFPGKRVRYAGEEVAAVAADTLGQARDAAALIRVTYDVYPAAVTLEDALAPGAPLVYDDTPNTRAPFVSEEGNVARGFADAAAIWEGEIHTPVQTHSPMETHAAVARWDAADRLTLWLSTQGVYSARSEVASKYGLPESNVRILCDFIGGGFGSKIGLGSYGAICIDLAKLANRPVKLIVDRKGEQLATGNRPDSLQTIKVGARADGTLTALDLRGYGTPGVGSGAGFAAAARELYTFESWYTEETSVYTNCGPAATMRAPGKPQGVYSLEVALDELALKLGMDPLELRLVNDPLPIRRRQFEYGASKFGWSQRNPVPGADPGPVKRGMGLASCVWPGGGIPGQSVRVRVHPSGQVEVESATQDIGTGTRTWMGMLVAEELGLPVSRITVRIGDSDLPPGIFSGGSMTTPSMSPPTKEAGALARAALAEVAAPLLGASADSLVFDGGQVVAPSGQSLSFDAVCARLPSPVEVLGTRTDQAKLRRDATSGVQFAEVEVDTRTGKITVLRVTAIHDAGRILNRLTAESQIIGGVIQGLNYALYEERVMDRASGVMLNANLEAYKIGGSRDMPVIEPILTDLASGGTYVGALGLGEPPIIPTAAALSNAVAHALGVRVLSIPMTPARVLAALHGAEERR